MRWLIVSPYLPHSAIGHGGGTCVFDLCRNLAREHEVELLCFRRSAELGLERELEAAGVVVHCVPFLSAQNQGWTRIPLALDRMRCLVASRLGRIPFMAVKYRRRTMEHALGDRLRQFRPQVVQIEYGFLGHYAAIAHRQRSDQGRPVVLLNTHELVTLARLRDLATAHSQLHQLRLRREVHAAARHESRFPGWADSVLCVTEQDRVLLHALTEAENLRTVPLGTDLERIPRARRTDPNPPQLLFVGSFGHPPNVEGVRHLLRDVMPLVWESRDDVRVSVVGANPPPELRRLVPAGDARVQFHGFVPSLDPHFDDATLFVAPLRTGGGIKIKILEAMARGSVVVTTPIGAEGIDESGRACVVVRGAPATAREILTLLDDVTRRTDLAERARHHVEQSFGWNSIIERLIGCVHDSVQHLDSTRD